MRITQHPILEYADAKKVSFVFDGKTYYGKENEPIAAALHANGVTVLGYSEKNRARGLYCAIGNCSSCIATVNGKPNVRTCITPLKEGMVVQMQHGKGEIKL